MINKERGSLLSELHNGDIVGIQNAEEKITRCSWLDAVKTTRAKSNIRTNCNQRIKAIDSQSGLLVLIGILDLKVSRIEEWCHDNGNTDNRVRLARDIDYLKEIISSYVHDIQARGRFTRFLTAHKFKLKEYHFGSLEIFSNQNISDVVFDYCCHPKTGDEIVAFKQDAKAHVHHKMCKHAAKLMEEESKMLFVRWRKERIFNYRMIVSMHNAKGSLAGFLTYLAKINIEINSIELGKEKEEHIRYCELEFQSAEGDLNRIRAKIEQKIKVIQFFRTDDAYRSN